MFDNISIDQLAHVVGGCMPRTSQPEQAPPQGAADAAPQGASASAEAPAPKQGGAPGGSRAGQILAGLPQIATSVVDIIRTVRSMRGGGGETAQA